MRSWTHWASNVSPARCYVIATGRHDPAIGGGRERRYNKSADTAHPVPLSHARLLTLSKGGFPHAGPQNRGPALGAPVPRAATVERPHLLYQQPERALQPLCDGHGRQRARAVVAARHRAAKPGATRCVLLLR